MNFKWPLSRGLMAIRDGRKQSSERTSILGNGRYEIMAISAIEMAIWIVTEHALNISKQRS